MFLGRGSQPLHISYRVCGSVVSSPRGPGRRPGRRRVFLYSEPSDCLSQHLSRPYVLHTVCIAIRYYIFLGGHTYRYPHINSWGVRSPAYPTPSSDACGQEPEKNTFKNVGPLNMRVSVRTNGQDISKPDPGRTNSELLKSCYR